MTKAKDPVTGEATTDPNDPNYDPNQDPLFQDPPPAVDPSGEIAPVAPYGYYPSGTPRMEPVPQPDTEEPCPVVSASDWPFDEKTIPSGCNQPLSAECVAYYNAKYAPEAKAKDI